MVELAKESTTVRRVLDPMFTYFDSKRHWVLRQGLANIVLSDMSYLMENSGIFFVSFSSCCVKNYFLVRRLGLKFGCLTLDSRESAIGFICCDTSSRPQECHS